MSRAPSVALAAFVLLLTTACGETQSYSRRQVERAFAQHGFGLKAGEMPISQAGATGDGAILVPAHGEPFLVIVTETDKDAAEWYDVLRRQATRYSFEARRGNVIATSDEGTSPAVRRRIRAALAELPAPG